MLKKLFVLILVLVISTGAFALSIDAQNSIPSGSAWTFTVDYGSLFGGKELRVLLNNEPLFTLFERNGTVFVDESQKSINVLSLNNSAGRVSASITGNSPKEEILLAEIYSSTNLVDSDSVTINFFVPISQSERDVLNSKINTLESELSKEKTKSLNMELDLNNKQEQINYLNTANSNLVDKIVTMNSELSSLKERGASNEQIVQTIQADLNSLVEQQRTNPIQGLALLGGNSSIIAFIFIALLAVIGFVVYRRGKKEKLYN